jgi:hypothetical protein
MRVVLQEIIVELSESLPIVLVLLLLSISLGVKMCWSARFFRQKPLPAPNQVHNTLAQHSRPEALVASKFVIITHSNSTSPQNVRRCVEVLGVVRLFLEKAFGESATTLPVNNESWESDDFDYRLRVYCTFFEDGPLVSAYNLLLVWAVADHVGNVDAFHALWIKFFWTGCQHNS